MMFCILKKEQQQFLLFQRLFRFDLFFLLVVFDGEYIDICNFFATWIAGDNV